MSHCSATPPPPLPLPLLPLPPRTSADPSNSKNTADDGIMISLPRSGRIRPAMGVIGAPVRSPSA